jgi:hypothetical protein
MTTGCLRVITAAEKKETIAVCQQRIWTRLDISGIKKLSTMNNAPADIKNEMWNSAGISFLSTPSPDIVFYLLQIRRHGGLPRLRLA